MNLKTMIVATFVAFTLTSTSTHAAEKSIIDAKAALEQPFAVSGNAMVRNKYVAFGNGVVLYNRGVIQSGVTLTHKPSGIFAGVWGSSGFNGNWNSGWDDEIDFTLGINIKLGDFNLCLSETYFDDHQVGEFAENDFWYTNACLAYKALQLTSRVSVTPFLQWEYYQTTSGTLFEGGNLASVGLNSTIKICPAVTLVSSTSLKWDDGIGGTEAGLLLKNWSSLNWSVSKHWTVNLAEISVWVPLTTHDHRNTECVVGVGASFNY